MDSILFLIQSQNSTANLADYTCNFKLLNIKLTSLQASFKMGQQ